MGYISEYTYKEVFLWITKCAIKQPLKQIAEIIIAIKYGTSKNIPLETLFSEKAKINRISGEIINFKSLQIISPGKTEAKITITAKSSMENVWAIITAEKIIKG